MPTIGMRANHGLQPFYIIGTCKCTRKAKAIHFSVSETAADPSRRDESINGTALPEDVGVPNSVQNHLQVHNRHTHRWDRWLRDRCYLYKVAIGLLRE